MGRGPNRQYKEKMKVKSFRLKESDMFAIKSFQEAENTDQSSALRALIQYGILYYTILESEE